jgi:hypothetical protein
VFLAFRVMVEVAIDEDEVEDSTLVVDTVVAVEVTVDVTEAVVVLLLDDTK